MNTRNVLADESLPVRQPWLTAMLLGSAGTPAAVILALPAPSPLDAILAWPLVLMDRLVGPGPNVGTVEEPVYEDTPVHVAAGVLGIALTWLFYVVVARAVIWRLTRSALAR
jgi:hypothetical protein